MGATWKATAYFDSGPHRFTPGRFGRLIFPPYSGPNDTSLPIDFTVRPPELIQTGRFIATTEATLWTIWATFKNASRSSTAGTLVLHAGESFSDMMVARFEATAPVDRGRAFSMPYEVHWIEVR